MTQINSCDDMDDEKKVQDNYYEDRKVEEALLAVADDCIAHKIGTGSFCLSLF